MRRQSQATPELQIQRLAASASFPRVNLIFAAATVEDRGPSPASPDSVQPVVSEAPSSQRSADCPVYRLVERPAPDEIGLPSAQSRLRRKMGGSQPTSHKGRCRRK